jgi:hypothetical protein
VPIELAVLSFKGNEARCRLMGSESVVSICSPQFQELVPGEIAALVADKQ